MVALLIIKLDHLNACYIGLTHLVTVTRCLNPLTSKYITLHQEVTH